MGLHAQIPGYEMGKWLALLHVERSSQIACYELRMACCMHVDRNSEIADYEPSMACCT
jgi:hypothetical protein